MGRTSKPKRFLPHATQQLAFRGATKHEAIKAIQEADWEPARHGRWECRRNYPFEDEWNGVFYQTKQVRPIFVEEDMEIVIITVYVYYF